MARPSKTIMTAKTSQLSRRKSVVWLKGLTLLINLSAVGGGGSPTVEPKVTIDQRPMKRKPTTWKGTDVRGKVYPAKITCGMRIIGIKLIARSLLRATAESARPIIRPAIEVRAIVM